MLHWSTCNAGSQRMFLARICRHVTLLNRFQKLATRCSTANIAKKTFPMGRYTGIIFRATSYHCKLALQVDQCNITLSIEFLGEVLTLTSVNTSYENFPWIRRFVQEPLTQNQGNRTTKKKAYFCGVVVQLLSIGCLGCGNAEKRRRKNYDVF